jgi:small subunit ribosomal protein S17
MTTDQTTAPAQTESDAHAHKRTLIGKVKSAKMQKTVVVEVVRSVRHPVYGKYVRRRKSYKAHDEQGQYKAGDVVEIREHKPISREKRWLVVRLVVRAVEA